MILFPPAKINLGLRVLRKRVDGYHDIETCFYPLALCDVLEAIPAPGGETVFSASGLPVSGHLVDNLVYKGYLLLNERFKLPPVALHLHKIIPMGAGLGGGSSDATYAILMLRDLFQLELSDKEVFDFAVNLGSDCAYFLQHNVCLAQGRGEILKPIPLSLKGWQLVLVKPDVHISTAEAFSTLVPQVRNDSLEALLSLPVEEWKGLITNDFEPTVFRQYPVIGEIKDKLYNLGATFALMSGSGASVYGLFKEPRSLDSYFPGSFIYHESLIR
jgi:4-diphosphocytidyl-2-C-methyl-D-erythritol kinase